MSNESQGGTIQFVESRTPALKAGTYRITIEQAVSGEDAKGKFEDSYVHTRSLYVQCERFNIDPADVVSVFPPANSRGDHDNVLPHIIFSHKTLPWERSPGCEGAPWLALLVFTEDDPLVVVSTVKVGDLQHQAFKRSPTDVDVKTGLPDTTASYADPTEGWELEPGQHTWDNCRVIDVPVKLFSAIAPSQNDLKWLAHARVVSDSSVEDASTQGDPKAKNRELSLVIANRLPKSNGGTTVHLVSLEGLSAFLPGDDGTPIQIKTAAKQEAQCVRLVSLYSWSFTCVDPKESFLGYFGNLKREGEGPGPLKRKYEEPGSATADDDAVKRAFSMGYVALNHDTRYGDRTVSWYRGPFVPFSTVFPTHVPLPAIDDEGHVTGSAPLGTAAEALYYDPSTGMFDMSYAAAWTLGRVLALGDKSFSVALAKWKQQVKQKTESLLHTMNVRQLFGATLTVAAPQAQTIRTGGVLDRTIAPASPPPPPALAVRRAAFAFVGTLTGALHTLTSNGDDAPGEGGEETTT
jgi:hypothetical protein